MYYIGIDLGGTNIAVGLVNEEGKIIDKKSTPTNVGRKSREMAEDMAKLSLELIKNNSLTLDDIKSIGVGSPGSIDKKNGIITYANNLNFENVKLREEINEFIDKPVYIDNDANCAAWAEVMAGAAKGVDDAIMITLGTGVGGGVIVNGKLYSGFNFCGGELGHMVIDPSGPVCTCGRKGCWEVFSSATGLINMTKQFAEKDKNSLLWNYYKDGRFSGRSAFAAEKEGDECAKAVAEKYTDYLAMGITNIINIFQPEVLAIGGGVSNEGENLIRRVREKVKKEVYGGERTPEVKIVKAMLGNDAGIVGAALLRE